MLVEEEKDRRKEGEKMKKTPHHSSIHLEYMMLSSMSILYSKCVLSDSWKEIAYRLFTLPPLPPPLRSPNMRGEHLV